MNPFVNNGNRSIELPEGCKDLIDVLNFASADSASSRENTREGLGIPGRAADVGAYVSRFSASTATVKSLWIHFRGCGTASVAVFCGKHGFRTLIFVDADREQLVRAVLARYDISPFQDDLLPANARGIQCQLSSISDLGKFIGELLTDGFSVTPETALVFQFRERNMA